MDGTEKGHPKFLDTRTGLRGTVSRTWSRWRQPGIRPVVDHVHVTPGCSASPATRSTSTCPRSPPPELYPTPTYPPRRRQPHELIATPATAPAPGPRRDFSCRWSDGAASVAVVAGAAGLRSGAAAVRRGGRWTLTHRPDQDRVSGQRASRPSRAAAAAIATTAAPASTTRSSGSRAAVPVSKPRRAFTS